MLSVVLKHLQARNTSLEKAIFVLYQEEAYKAFKETLTRLVE